MISPFSACRSSTQPGMALCHAPVAIPLRSPLMQIKKGYAVVWNDLALSVADGSDTWTVRVHAVAGGRLLYEAHRSSLAEAKAAGVEFAMFRLGGATLANSPEK